MNEIIFFQWNIFIISIITGMAITFIYDNLRCIRKVHKHSDFWIAIEDLLFWVTASIIIVNFIYEYNFGEFRNYVVIGLIVGMVIYLITISCVYTKIATYILCKINFFFVYITQKPKNILKKLYKKVKIICSKRKQKLLILKGEKVQNGKKSKQKKEQNETIENV